jgi:hypothetical protein
MLKKDLSGSGLLTKGLSGISLLFVLCLGIGTPVFTGCSQALNSEDSAIQDDSADTDEEDAAGEDTAEKDASKENSSGTKPTKEDTEGKNAGEEDAAKGNAAGEDTTEENDTGEDTTEKDAENADSGSSTPADTDDPGAEELTGDLVLTIRVPESGVLEVEGLPGGEIRLSRGGTAGLSGELRLRVDGYDYSTCLVDGKNLAAAQGEYIISAADYSLKGHILTLIGIKDGIPYGREVFFTILE